MKTQLDVQIQGLIKDLKGKDELSFQTAKADIFALAASNREKKLTATTLGMLFELYANIPFGTLTEESYYSRVITTAELSKLNVHFQPTNGCLWARDNSGHLGKKYNLKREHESNNLYSVKLDGRNKSITQKKRGVSTAISKSIKKHKCVVLGTVSNIEVDHKSGRYDEESNLTLATQRESDYQPMSRPANDAKKVHCTKCTETSKRYDARDLNFSIGWLYGDENTPVCEGCYWHDVAKFHKESTANCVKNK